MSYCRSQSTAWRNVAGETILIDLEAKVMYGLNETAAFVWEAIETVPDLRRIARLMSDENGCPPCDVAELERFCAELEELGLLHRAEPGETIAARPVEARPPKDTSPPAILWREEVRRLAATCAFLPGQNPLCNQVPTS